jgi:hypothetical protein
MVRFEMTTNTMIFLIATIKQKKSFFFFLGNKSHFDSGALRKK